MTGPSEHPHMLPAEGIVDREPLPPAEADALLNADRAAVEPVTNAALAVGIEVGRRWAEQDRYDPNRPTLPQLVAEVVERRTTLGRRATDGAPPERDRDTDTLGRLLRRIVDDEDRDVFLMRVGDDLIIDGTVNLTADEQATLDRLGVRDRT